MKTTVFGYKVAISTKIDASNRLSAKAVVPDLDSMVIARASGPTITGRLSQADKESIILRVLTKTVAEFRLMASMAVGQEEAR